MRQTAVLEEVIKVKLSEHQRKRMVEDKGHRYDETTTEFLIQDHKRSGVQEEGRHWWWGRVSGKRVLTIVSAGVSAGTTILRVVTTHYRPRLGRRQRPGRKR